MAPLSQQTQEIQMFIHMYPQVDMIKDTDELHRIYTDLIDCLVDHNHLYYIKSDPIISDKEYDDLFSYLKKIEELHPEIISSNSPTQGLIGQVSEGFKKASHKFRMMSLENTYNGEDLIDRDKRVKKILEKEGIPEGQMYYCIEPKYDGLSIELIYENGIYTQAITRGDGVTGEDVTENVRTIKNIPKNIKSKTGFPLQRIYFRGEIVMPKSELIRINKEREEDGELPYANTRNLASGSLKQLDSKITATRNLECYIYEIKLPDEQERNNEIIEEILDIEINQVKWIKRFGFGYKAFEDRVFTTIKQVKEFCLSPETREFLHTKGNDLDYDGLVIKVNSELRGMIGSTDHHPRRAVAYKFPAQLASTQILSVDFQVGRTGIITPVANLQPIELSGVTIKRVSLHNFDFITSKDLHIGDYVRIQRSGEVIPYIVSVITERRGDVQDIAMPKVCPSCGGKIINQEIHYYCKNPECPAQLKEQILHFGSKQCMDIQGIGDSIVDILVDQQIVKSIPDIYKIADQNTQILLRKFPGIGEKKISEMVSEIEISKQQPFWRLLNGLGIPHVGKKMAQDIAQALVTQQSVCLEDMIHVLTDRDFLLTVYGIGEKTVDALVDYFSDSEHQNMLLSFRDQGMKFTLDVGGFDLFEEKKETFSITGVFPISREVLVTTFEKQGYTFHDNPSKATQLMLIGEKPGSKKAKAQELGLTIYEGWKLLCKKFPFLASVVIEEEKPSTNKPNQTSLF